MGRSTRHLFGEIERDRNKMNAKDDVKFEASFAKWTFGGYAAVALGVLIGLLGQYWRIQLGQEWWVVGNIISAITIFWAILLFLTTGFGVYARSRTSFVVYKDRLELSSQIFRKGTQRLEASQIESVDGAQSLLAGQRYGTVTVRGSGGTKLELETVTKVDEVVEEIRKVAGAAPQKQDVGSEHSKVNAQKIVSPAGSAASEIEKLYDLFERGILTKQEFERAKRSLLDGT